MKNDWMYFEEKNMTNGPKMNSLTSAADSDKRAHPGIFIAR